MSKELESYNNFIDNVVSIKESAMSKWIRKGSFPDTDQNKKRNEILGALTEGQRSEVALIIQEAKESGIHDLLVLLGDTSKIEYNGIKLPVEPFDTELNYDFIARGEGDEWPE